VSGLAPTIRVVGGRRRDRYTAPEEARYTLTPRRSAHRSRAAAFTERVAGVRKWQGLGHQVRKGEEAFRIFGYSTKKVTEEDENGDEVEKRIARFPILSVFDIAQTDLVDGATDSSIVEDLTCADGHGIVDALSAYLDGEGWTAER
jgi:antirestriction protein ArdC